MTQSESSDEGKLLIKNSIHHICSLSFCSSIEEFYVRNNQTELEANNNSYVRIDFKVKLNLNNTTRLFKSYGYLLANGSVLSQPVDIIDERRTKM